MREDWGGDVNGCWVVHGWRAELDVVVNRRTRMCVRHRVSVGPSAPLWYSGVWGSYTPSLAICLSFRARASRCHCMRAPCARVPRLPSIRAPLARVPRFSRPRALVLVSADLSLQILFPSSPQPRRRCVRAP
jgi:hypothetical protein